MADINYLTPLYTEIDTVGTIEGLVGVKRVPIGIQPQIVYIDNPFLEIAIRQTIQDLKKRVQKLESKEKIEYSTYILNFLSSKKLRLEKPLSIVLKETPEGFIAELNSINAWGHGDIEEQAIENLCADLENLYFDLERNKKNLGKEMQRQWEFLQEFLQKKGKRK